ncbi:MAG: peptidase M14 [Bryobacteraceae bacterium]|nr:peptidase M14 [Bryobacteraceae bacterium]
MQKLLVSLYVFLMPVLGQNFEFWPGAEYNPSVPTFEKVLGFAPGTKHATAADIEKYFEALAAAQPNRMKIFEYAKSWEGRRLYYAVIGSEQNIRRIAEIKSGMQKLHDPRKTSADEARKLMATLPAVVGISSAVHGNEISSPEAVMLAAYHLLAARNNGLVESVLANVLTILDPLQNPDGRDRFVHSYRQSEGLEPDESIYAAERNEPWPGGRSNHYLFDMNRDWFALTQPETRGRVKYLNEWLPLIHVDLHEMGTESTYFFAPGAAPYNPHLTALQKQQMDWFGKNNAQWFDKLGYRYFTREVFDEFYPGYGASWPWYYGGMGMTYENASVRGLVVRKADGTLYDFQNSVKMQFVASVSTLETAAEYRPKLLDSFWTYARTAVEEGQKEEVKEWILPRRGDVSAVDKLAHLLSEQGVEVRKAGAAFRNGGTEYPAGSYTVGVAQPRKRMVRALLDPQVPLDPEFVKEQERRRKKGLRDEIYDVTAWSLPMLYNVEAVGAAEVSQGQFAMVPATGYQPKGAAPGKAELAYLVPWGTQAAGRFLTAALRADLKILSVNRGFTQEGRKYPSGTLVVMVAQNPASVHETVARLAVASGAEVVATGSGWVEEGINFGSNRVARLKKPRVAMVWDQPTSSLAAGHTRFVLERLYGYPVTVLRGQTLGMVDLSKFDVLIMPSGGNYAGVLGGGAPERLKTWVRGGGVVIGVGGAVSYLSSQQVGLLSLQQEGLAPKDGSAPGRPVADAKPAAGPAPGKIFEKYEDYEKAIRADREMPPDVAGVLVRARPDPDAWISAGLPETLHVLVDGRAIYSPLKSNQGLNAVIYAGPDELLASGLLWEENRKQLAFKPFVVVQDEGRGAVIGFTADPNFRAYMDGLNVLFLNAVFRAPALGGRQPGQ